MEMIAWFLSTDSKRIAILYLAVITTLSLVGGLLGIILRLELSTAQENLISSAVYGRLFSMHGIILLFFVLLPSIPAVLGTFLLPRMIGSRGLAFPRLALTSWYLFAGGGVLITVSLLAGGVDTGWTFYAPYSTGTGRLLATSAIILASCGMILVALNFVATVHRMRARGLTWSELPLLVWALYVSAWLMVVAVPVLLACMALLIVEPLLGVGIFNPETGGDPLLFQRLFWFFGRPLFYMIILPAIGIVSELLRLHTRERVWGSTGIVYSMVAIALLGFLTAGIHLVVISQSLAVTLFSSLLSLMSVIPFLVILFSWVMTLYRGAVSFSAAMFYVLGFLVLVTIGGLGGLFLSASSVGAHLHSTYFVLAHFHYLLAGAALMSYLGGLHFWWSELSGRELPDALGRISAGLIFCGINMTFLPQYVLGFLGMPRRYSTYPVEFETFQMISSAGVPILALAYLVPISYFAWSLKWGRLAGTDPTPGLSSDLRLNLEGS